MHSNNNSNSINSNGSVFINGKRMDGNNLNTIKGSDILDSKIITAEKFSKVRSFGSADINFTVSESYMVEIIADDNLIELIELSYSGDTLIVGLKPNVSFETKSEMTVNLSAPSLKSFSIAGSGDGDISGLNQDSFHASISGSGDIDVTGRVDSTMLEISGSGDIDASKLLTHDLIATVAGSGNIDAHATGVLTAQILGSGNIKVKGMPRVAEANSQGSGSIKIK